MGMGKPKTLATRKYVKKCMKSMVAVKAADTPALIGAAPTTAGRVDPIRSFQITEGSSDADRTGNWIKRDWVRLRFLAEKPLGTLPAIYFRIVVFRDSQTNGGTPAVADVLSSAAVQSGYNADNVSAVGGKRFTILRDYFFVLNSQAAGATAESLVNAKAWTTTIKNAGVVHYDATGGTIADIVSGEIFILSLTTSATAPVQCQAEIKYHDGV